MRFRPFVALAPLVLLAACGEDGPADDSRSASGEVLEGTISDEMLPVDSVRSEPPLEDPDAFAQALSTAGGAPQAEETAAGEDAAESGEAPEGGAATEAAAEPE